jgi:23S rRNA (cytosine1962-C5)-methyltransferase
MATVACLKAGAQVTHVDLSKRALDWAKQNIELNRADESALRFIREDALSFLAKEVKRQKTYDIIIADPPSFSRVSDKETWDLDAVLHTLLRNLSCLLAGPHSSLYYTCHSTEWGSLVVENVLSDLLGDKKHRAESSLLVVQEQETSRKLPAGFLTRLSLL